MFFPTSAAEDNLFQEVSNFKAVGVTEIRNSHGAAIRIFYPSDADPAGFKATPLFRNPLAFVVEGYSHTFFGFLLPHVVVSFISYMLSWLVWLHPLAWTTLPRCYNDIPIGNGKFPLVVWSHGLTGTGCEHGMLATALALQGNIVALTHHSDGSSSMADINTGSNSSSAFKLKYIHPSYSRSYDTTFRQRQAEHRAKEVEEARTLLLSSHLSTSIAHGSIFCAGFSFGAATTGLVASQHPEAYTACILIDGWWHIELKSINVNQDLPIQVHKNGIKIPALFIGSSEFQSYEALCNATLRVQKLTPTNEFHVLPDTRHGNFMDAIWWMPAWMTRSLKFSGKCNPHRTYTEYVALVARFIELHSEPSR